MTLYRDDWTQLVSSQRVRSFEDAKDQLSDEDERISFVTSTVEAFRESGDYVSLASIFDSLGNVELRDKYIELALDDDSSDDLVCFLRGLQDRPDLIPAHVAERALAADAYRNSWTQRARTLMALGKRVEAADDYVRGIRTALDDRRYFSAAFYLNEMVTSGVINALFERALNEASAEGDLWWQYRCLQELGWTTERKQFLLDHATEIENGDNSDLKASLLLAQGRPDEAQRVRLGMLRNMCITRVEWELDAEDEASDEDADDGGRTSD
ncbi:MAG: hypothetical protein M3N28_07380 [Actinomycetota bacterium]|nr:hypothetical protein [Actinomycetota bacterium]